MGFFKDFDLDEQNTENNVAEATDDGLVNVEELNQSDNNQTLSDQSDIDKLIASLSGDIGESAFAGMSSTDDSGLFEEVGFDEPSADVLENAQEDISTAVDDMLVEMENNGLEPEVQGPSDFVEFEQMPSFSGVDMIADVEEVPEQSDMFEDTYQEDDLATEDLSAGNDFVDYSTQNIPSASNSDQCNVITKGTIINGGMISDCSLNVMGTINGDIECNGKLSIFGNVVGNSVASDVYVNTRNLIGNVDSYGSVKIALGTIVVGSIKAKSAVIAGAVKGNLDVNGPVILDSTAIIKGDITAKSVQMNNGAILEGKCSFAYADINIDQIFEN